MYTINTIADYLMTQSPMNHLKLQKLCYFAQAEYLVKTNKPLINEIFEAWVHGPVSRNLYCAYQHHGWNLIPQKNCDISYIDDFTMKFLHKFYETYGGYSPTELENLSHVKGEPWDISRGNLSPYDYSERPISNTYIKKHFKSRMN